MADINQNNPVVVITGAARGIGKATALLLAKSGYHVVLNYLQSTDEITKIESELKKLAIQYLLVKADISTKAGREDLVSKTIQKFKHINALVNNAGTYQRTSFKNLTEESYDKTLNTNLKASVFVTQAFLPYFQADSSVIFLSSINAYTGSAQGVDYVISKIGLIGVTKSLALELAPKIRINAIAPGNIDTDMITSDTSEKRQERVAATPMQRIGRTEDIANMIQYLISDKSSFITGQVLHVNGGKLMI